MSLFMPVVSGSLLSLSGSLPAIQAAALRARPAAPPEVMKAASTPIRSATKAPALVSSSPMSVKLRLASSIFSRTILGGPEPPTTVPVPTALMDGRTPSLS